MNQYEAISYRRSVRKFDFTPVSAVLMKKIKHYIQELSPWNENCAWELEILDHTGGEKKFGGFAVVHAPYYLVFYGENQPEARRNAGYILEQMVLYLTTKGLGCCYQGGASLPKEKREDSLHPLMAVAFGYPTKKLLRDGAVAKRHPLNELCVFKEEAGETEKTLLYAARLAPSAFNGQPWRFVVYKNRIHVFARKTPWVGAFAATREVDLGIVLCHMQLAAEEQWLVPAFLKDEKIMEKNMKKLDYVVTCTYK